VLRDRDTTGNGTLDERLYAMSDANWNVTGVVDTSGVVQERIEYTPYGRPQFLAANFTPRSSSAFDWRTSYTGREWESAVWLYDFRHRWYIPLVGVFSSRDPIGYADYDFCLYQYVRSTPTGLVDPLGTSWLLSRKATERHHWFLAYHSRPGYGQSLVDKKCRCPRVMIHRFTTEYTLGQHRWIHSSVSYQTVSPFDSYNSSYHHVLSSATSCCDLLLKMRALMLAWHSAVRLAASNGYLVDEVGRFDLIRWRGAEKSTLMEYRALIVTACGRRPHENERRIETHRIEYFRQIRDRHGIGSPRSKLKEIWRLLFPGGPIPVGVPGVPRLPVVPRIPIAA
jgi:RHS repeat-associated protein